MPGICELRPAQAGKSVREVTAHLLSLFYFFDALNFDNKDLARSASGSCGAS
jgi:hypothetical protein